ncbi:MAG: MoxR family ATPase [Chloroflexi bacterium]|nr:MoxR family ATPase [Chloroflexota bacterium]
MIMASILAGGHVLLEDFPGLGKTLIARSFAAVLGLDFKRIQFTPDLLPGDITGGYIFNRGENRFDLRRGPVFANILLADEINRASPKTQSALLEAMQEGQVTLEGETLPLPDPFLVLATQNPIEYEGTFPLPEAQLDRFMLKLSVGYPGVDEEKEILHRRGQRRQDEVTLAQVVDAGTLREMRRTIEDVHVDDDLETYIAAIVHETRKDRRVAVGASPRGSLAFLKMARAHAVLQGRDFVLPDDIKRFGGAVLSHRIILQPEYWMASRVTDDVIRDVLEKVPVPVIVER